MYCGEKIIASLKMLYSFPAANSLLLINAALRTVAILSNSVDSLIRESK